MTDAVVGFPLFFFKISGLGRPICNYPTYIPFSFFCIQTTFLFLPFDSPIEANPSDPCGNHEPNAGFFFYFFFLNCFSLLFSNVLRLVFCLCWCSVFFEISDFQICALIISECVFQGGDEDEDD